jgi:hypothetical protein
VGAAPAPDVLWGPEGVLPRRIATPTVATVHDVAPLLFDDSKPADAARAFRRAIPRSVRAATLVTCVSETTASDVERLWACRVTASASWQRVDERFSPATPPRRARACARHSVSTVRSCCTSARSSRARASTC